MNKVQKKKQTKQSYLSKIKSYISTWEQRGYYSGIPDQAPIRLEQLNKVPSYRQICLAILKNDYSLKSLGYTPIKSNVYNVLKREELKQRGIITQLDIK